MTHISKNIEPIKVVIQEKETAKTSQVKLYKANQVIAVVKCLSGRLGFEIANTLNDLSGNVFIKMEQSVSSFNWLQAVDSKGDDFIYELTPNGLIIENVSEISEGLWLRFVAVESVTGTLDIYTKI